MTEAVVASGDLERAACDNALTEGQRVIGQLLIYSLNSRGDGEMEFLTDLDGKRADFLIVADMASKYEQYHTWWCEIMTTSNQLRHERDRLDTYVRGMAIVTQWLGRKNV